MESFSGSGNYGPAWSPTGQCLAYVEDGGSQRGTRDIVIYYLTKRVFSNVTPARALDDHPAWSPDGRQIAFSTVIDGQWDIATLEILDDMTTSAIPRTWADVKLETGNVNRVP